MSISKLVPMIVACLFVASAAFAGKAVPAKKAAPRAPSSQACSVDTDCADPTQFDESCRLIGTGNTVCDGKQQVNVRCVAGQCSRYLGGCQDCKWTTLPQLPAECSTSSDCAQGNPAQEACSMITATNQKCTGNAQVIYQCATRADGQKKCDKLVGPCQGC
jgi:hypothetical protein